ncbi:MAG: zinc-ribbon domain-containing protein [Clostridia bacterium]|nr:zinc-ribbon domain-containing protein [Clostridia bacterium]
MATCKKCGSQLAEGEKFCPNCGENVAAPAASKEVSGPLFWRIYVKAFAALMEKPFRLWGVSLLGNLLIAIGSSLAGVAIPAIGIAIAMLFNVALAAIFLKGYHREQVYCRELFDTFKDWATIKRVLTGMGWSALWVFLWGLIPIVGPIFAIIKGYEYGLVPYILVKKPELNAIQARELSIEKTKGHKGQMFLADLVVYAIIFIVALVLGLLGMIPYVGVLFLIIMVLVFICIGVLLPLFKGLVSAAFYEELIGDDKE